MNSERSSMEVEKKRVEEGKDRGKISFISSYHDLLNPSFIASSSSFRSRSNLLRLESTWINKFHRLIR